MRFQRTEMLIGKEGLARLAKAHVLVFGLGGVGGSLAESLARAGVGALTLVDNDRVHLSNINRQVLATEDSLSELKTEAAKKRIAAINPDCRVTVHNLFYLPEHRELITGDFDYIADAIDTVTAKIDIVLRAKELSIPIISCMGTGNKMHPEKLEIADLFSTSVCPLCRVMRTELKKRAVHKLTVVYSKEEPIKPAGDGRTPGSMSFVPPVAGMLMASRIVQDLIG